MLTVLSGLRLSQLACGQGLSRSGAGRRELKKPGKDDVDPGVHVAVPTTWRCFKRRALPCSSWLHSLEVGGWEGVVKTEGAVEVFSAERLVVLQPVEAGRTRVAARSQGELLVKRARLQNVLGRF